ncbi:acyl-CoA dehydrogenase family protein [Spirillospora sp. CA-294931]|uniref:acyl-CoA dehydrogenase family protein n=1 Tax=Spirillospora sp. CA-294931 TaxID=3240042 RepID=UPI003D9242F7
MDFDLDETQRELRGLADGLLDREASRERLEAFEASGAPYDAATWKALGQAGLLGAGLPEELGGAGLCAVETAVILREVGRHVAPVPAYASLALAAPAIVRHGTPEQRALLAPLNDGEAVFTGAYREAGPAGRVTATARLDGDGYVLDGVKTFVPCAEQAALILVPARTDGGEVAVFLVEPGAVRLTPQHSLTTEPLSRVELAGARVDAAARLGPGAWDTLRRSAVAGAVALASGVIESALGLTTEHIRTREQFGRPLAGFQAVTMRIADVYIAKRTLDVALWAAVWRLAEERDDADEVLAVAAFNVCEPVAEALYTCQHLHGGLGMDVTYPLHRYFAWGKHAGHLLGGAEDRLDDLGELLAAREG